MTEKEKHILFDDDPREQETLSEAEFQEQLYKTLSKLDEIRHLQKLIREDGNRCVLVDSIQEMMDFTEENSYNKLLKQLKIKGL